MTKRLLSTILCEAAVVVSGQPVTIAGNLNVQTGKMPCLARWLLGVIGSILKRPSLLGGGFSIDAASGTRRDGYLSGQSFAVGASFETGRWSTNPLFGPPLWSSITQLPFYAKCVEVWPAGLGRIGFVTVEILVRCRVDGHLGFQLLRGQSMKLLPWRSTKIQYHVWRKIGV